MTTITSYSALWTHIYAEVPTDTKGAKAAARKFFKTIASLGPTHIVRSRGRVCGLICCRADKAASVLNPILPPDGRLHLVAVTDKQFERSSVTWGRVRTMADCGK